MSLGIHTGPAPLHPPDPASSIRLHVPNLPASQYLPDSRSSQPCSHLHVSSTARLLLTCIHPTSHHQTPPPQVLGKPPPPHAQEALRASGAGPAGLPCPCASAFSVVGLPQRFHGGTGCKLLGDATSTFSWAHPRRHPQDPFRQAWPCVIGSFIRNTYLVFDPILGTEHPKPLEFPK